jgi:tRNA1(Val) A37 N6-methylase TrmN6
MFAEADLTDDAFLCGRLRLWQPRRGYRAATDPVWLAAACPARGGERVLDLGCGAGAAMLCLAARVPGLRLAGLERQADYADLARRNCARNALSAQVEEGDLRAPPPALRVEFDQVIANPPWYPAGGTRAADPGRALALQVDETPLADWVAAAARRLRPGGTLTLICAAGGLPELLAALGPRLGSACVLPLAPRAGRPAGRVILRATKGGRGAFRLLAPMVVHAGPSHLGDREDYTPEAEAILRGGAGIAQLFA